MGTETVVVDLFYRLPEECVANVLSLTTPRDACILSCVSTTFRSVADSNAVWDNFLPSGYQNIIASSSSSSLCFSSKKELYLSLCDNPLLIDGGKKSLSLEKPSGKKCYMLSPKDLYIVWIETPTYWRWISLPEARFPEVAELLSVCWLEICGKINRCMLSPDTLYTVYFVFKSVTSSYGFESQPIEVAVGLVGGESHKRTVFLDAERGHRRQYQIVPRRFGLFHRSRIGGFHAPQLPENEDSENPKERGDDSQYPKKRGDGWLEIELGEFFNGGGGGEEDGVLEMSVLEVKGGDWKTGLIVQGIEIRPK